MKINAKGIVAAAIACVLSAGAVAGTALASPYEGYEQASVAEETAVRVNEASLAGESKTYVRKDGSIKERNKVPGEEEEEDDGAMGGEGEF